MNSMTLTTHDSAFAPLSPGRLFGSYLAEIRCEFMRQLRNAGLALPILVLPVALYALFALLIFGEAIAKDPTTGVYIFAGMAVMSVTMPALFGIGATLAMERELGLMRLRRALDEFVVDGIKTTLPLFRDLVGNPDVANGDYDIHWLEKYLASTAE